ncbi:hypothetical protein D3C78_1289190 [compost metagenome]
MAGVVKASRRSFSRPCWSRCRAKSRKSNKFHPGPPRSLRGTNATCTQRCSSSTVRPCSGYKAAPTLNTAIRGRPPNSYGSLRSSSSLVDTWAAPTSSTSGTQMVKVSVPLRATMPPNVRVIRLRRLATSTRSAWSSPARSMALISAYCSKLTRKKAPRRAGPSFFASQTRARRCSSCWLRTPVSSSRVRR